MAGRSAVPFSGRQLTVHTGHPYSASGGSDGGGGTPPTASVQTASSTSSAARPGPAAQPQPPRVAVPPSPGTLSAAAVSLASNSSSSSSSSSGSHAQDAEVAAAVASVTRTLAAHPVQHCPLPATHGTLAYRVWGTSGAPVRVLFIQGLLHEGHAWLPQLEHLGAYPDIEAVAFDNRGIGHSSDPPYLPWTTEDQAKDAAALLDHLGWHKAHIVGSSMGAMIAQQLAAIMPQRVLSLSLLTTHAGGALVVPTMKGLRHFLGAMLSRTNAGRVESMLGLLYGPRSWQNPELLAKLRSVQACRLAELREPSWFAKVGQVCAALSHYSSTATLGALSAHGWPTLVVTGTHDLLVREANSHQIAYLMGVPIAVLPGAGHGVIEECAAEVNQLLHGHVTTAAERTVLPDKDLLRALSYRCGHSHNCMLTSVVDGALGYLALKILVEVTRIWRHIPFEVRWALPWMAAAVGFMGRSSTCSIRTLIMWWRLRHHPRRQLVSMPAPLVGATIFVLFVFLGLTRHVRRP